MLKQTFDRDSIAKVITKKDVWKWSLWNNSDEQELALSQLERTISDKDANIDRFFEHKHKGKPTYQASTSEDMVSIKLLDKNLRRIYRVKQSDRNRIILQVKHLLEDNGDYSLLRLDIADCYKSIDFGNIIEKLSSDMVLSPNNLKLMESIQEQCARQSIEGLPRGLRISPTLAELFLENIDREIARQDGVIYVNRYVDDFLLLVEKPKQKEIENLIKNLLEKIGLELNKSPEKRYAEDSRKACFDFLGYRFEVTYHSNSKPNRVALTISQKKLNRIKTKIALSFNDFLKNHDFELLKQRINYLATIRPIKEHKNGNLLGGIAYNYYHVTDNFQCLEVVDKFYIAMVHSTRFMLSEEQKESLLKKSFYGFAIGKKKGIFTRKKIKLLARIWKNA